MATVNESLRDEAIAHSVWISRYATGVAIRIMESAALKVMHKERAE